LTYAVATAAFHTDDAINCADVAPVDRLLAANRLKRADFDAEVDAAFSAWAAVADVSFVRVTEPAVADIVIGAEGVPSGRAFTNVATDRGSPSPSWQAARLVSAVPDAITRAMICLNPDQPWKIGFDGNLAVYDVRYALMHEIGHAIGLDHPDAPNTVMDYRYTEKFSGLQPGDIAGAAALYGTRLLIAKATNWVAPVPARNR
jgi:predicted Zn-dependent protease